MESTTRAKPKIFYAGAPAEQDLNTLAAIGDVSGGNDQGGLEQAEVLWVACAATPPDQYEPLLEKALNAGKTLVMTHLSPSAHDALAKLLGMRHEDGVATLMVSRNPRATTPSSYTCTVLDAAPTSMTPEQLRAWGLESQASTEDPTREPHAPFHLDMDKRQRDWGRQLQAHRAQATLHVGGPGLIPPPGVMYGIRTATHSLSMSISGDWPDTRNESQPVALEISSSFHVYRENGRSDADYVVIRVQQATSIPGAHMVSEYNLKGYWHFEMALGCSTDRNAPLLCTSPGTTAGPSLITQLSIPLHVRSIQDGGCHAHFWPATHGPVARTTEGWQLSQRCNLSQGLAKWTHFHHAPWNSFDDPPAEFERWKGLMYDNAPIRVKDLNDVAASTFTVENCAAWRFKASTIDTHPEVTFLEFGQQQMVAFATIYASGNGTNAISTKVANTYNKSLKLNLPQITEDLTSPCR